MRAVTKYNLNITNKSLLKSNIQLFKKKVFNNRTIPLELNFYNYNTNIIKHFSPSNKEWINTIYSFNKNIIKYLPIKDSILFNIIKSYFNLYNYKWQKKINKKNIPIRFRRLSILNIFVSKTEIKHTNSKVIITVYIFNRQKKYLTNKLNNIRILEGLKERVELIKKQNLKIIEEIEKEKSLINYDMIYNTIYENQHYKDFLIKSLEKEILTIYIKQLLHFNKSKFENTHLFVLSNIIKKIYDKDIEFNIINLKYIYLNSDLLTQLIALKLRRNKNYLIKVLKKCFKIIKISPLYKVILINFFKKELNRKILEKLNFLDKCYNDNINTYLYNLLSLDKKGKLNNFVNFFLSNLKYKEINGLRLEVKGRLSRRRTASKSVFKFKFKGNLKNIDSSCKELSTVILRGHLKPNIQYTKLNSKTRNGSFGIKGWISSK